MSLPKYPEEKPLELSDMATIEKLVSAYPPYSDFNFVSMWCYDTHNNMRVSLLNNNLVVKFTDYKSTTPFYSFIGTSHVENTIERLIERSKELKMQPHLCLVPEICLTQLSKDMHLKYSITEDRDNHDYIVLVNEIHELKGNTFMHKRHQVNTFKKCHEYHEMHRLDLTSKKDTHAMLDLFIHWAITNKKSEEETKNELEAFNRLFKLAEIANNKFYSLGVVVDGKLIGFSIEEGLSDGEYVMGHFGKANTTYRGIYTYLEHLSMKHYASKGYKYLNLEQDLGIENLRIAKMHYQPQFFLKKFTVKQNAK